MDAPLIAFFPSSSRFPALPPAGCPSRGGGFLALLPSLSEEEGREAALTRGCHVICGGETAQITVLDDGGKILLRYGGLHEGGESSEEKFPLFFPGGLLCALSFGRDILFPEHARLLVLGGAELLLVAPRRSDEPDLLESFARVRAAENQIFIALLLPFPEGPLFFGPGGESLPPDLSPEGGWITLGKKILQKTRKTYPLRSFRRPDLYSGLTAL